MQRLSLLCCLLVLWLLCSSLASHPDGNSQDTPDIRERLLASFQRADKDLLPDTCLLTHFSYLGKLTTEKGRIYVCDAKWVLKGMQAPRGFSYIVFSDQHLRYLGKIQFDENHPLWCHQGKLYLFGDIEVPYAPGWSHYPQLPERYRQGNVIDVSKGFAAMRIYHQKVYGSSGG